MDKKWILKKTSKEVTHLSRPANVDTIINSLLASRGFSISQIKTFLNPNYEEKLHDPFLFNNMRAVVEMICNYIKAGKNITVYGDYDADGVSSAAVMIKTLEFVKELIFPSDNKKHSLIDVYIPHRETEGYGLNIQAVEALAAKKTNLIITVDGGIRSVAEVEYAQKLGMDVIITDHHEPGKQLPSCLIINPKVEGEGYPFFDLAGVGVAFKVSQALFKRLSMSDNKKILSLAQKNCEAFEKWLLDLVAIGTIADLMPLLDENRVLAKYGLMVLNKTKRVGLQALIKIAQSAVDKNGHSRELDSWQVGFQLAPRLNAAGRLGHASNAYQLLITDDQSEAEKIAFELNETNRERQQLTEDIFQVADGKIKLSDKILFAVWPGLTDKSVASESWPGGVMGLVAGKLTEKYYRPALAITRKENLPGRFQIVGSARSIAEFNITTMLEECAEFLENFGGHKQAAGFTVREGMLDQFLDKARFLTEKKLKDEDLKPVLDIDLEINFLEICENLYHELNKLKPFGVKNPQPKFLTKNIKIININLMGSDSQHLKLKLLKDGVIFDAIAFGADAEWKNLTIGLNIDLVYYIDINEWNGRSSVQLKIIDIKTSDNKKII